MSELYQYFFVWAPQNLPFLLSGALVTLELTVTSMIFALAIGLAAALGRLHGPLWLKMILRCYIEIWRDVPVVVQLLVIYFTLPQIGIVLPAFWAGVAGLSLNVGAYLTEVFRSTIGSVERGQWEAALSVGMSRAKAYRRVILPQAFRIALPTIGGYFISLLKDCSLVSFIAVNELLRNGQILIASTFLSMQIYFMIAIIYFGMSFTASMAVSWLERQLTPRFLRGAAEFKIRRTAKIA